MLVGLVLIRRWIEPVGRTGRVEGGNDRVEEGGGLGWDWVVGRIRSEQKERIEEREKDMVTVGMSKVDVTALLVGGSHMGAEKTQEVHGGSRVQVAPSGIRFRRDKRRRKFVMGENQIQTKRKMSDFPRLRAASGPWLSRRSVADVLEITSSLEVDGASEEI